MELFKKQNDGLGNISVSPHSKSRNGGRVIRGHRGGKNRKRSNVLKMSPTNPQHKLTSNLNDYGRKASMQKAIKRAELK